MKLLVKLIVGRQCINCTVFESTIESVISELKLDCRNYCQFL